MDLPTPVRGTETSSREILRGSTSGMKRKNKRKMVGVVNNTLDVSEETRNEEKKKGSEMRE